MLNIPERLKTIHHPLVKEAYLKRNHSSQGAFKDILVIQTITGDKNKIPEELLLDLPPIQYIAEQEVGRIDEIDIVTH